MKKPKVCNFYSCKNECNTKYCSEECRVFDTYKSVPKLKKYIWRIYSQYIKKRDRDERGYVRCITCSTVDLWNSSRIHAGHFLHGDNPGTWINDFNVHGQCDYCNVHMHGQGAKYAMRMLERYGEAKIKELEKLHNNPPTTWNMLPLREAYKDLIKKYGSLEGK